MRKKFAILTMVTGVFFLSSLCRAQDQSADECLKRGDALKKSGKYKEAVNEYTRAIKMAPKGTEAAAAYYKRGCVNVDWLGRYNDAVSDCGRAIGAEPNNVDYYYCRGLAYYKMKSWSQAIKDFNKITEINPVYMSGEVYYALGFSHNELRDYGQAIRSYSKAIELNPHQAKYYLDRGCSYFEINNVKAAKKDWLKAKTLNPDEQLQKSIDNNLRILAKQTGGGEPGEAMEGELPRQKKIPWAQKQRSRSPSDKALEELLEDEEIRVLYEEYMGLTEKASVASKEKNVPAVVTYYTDSLPLAAKLKGVLRSKGKSTDLAEVFEKMSSLMIYLCKSVLAINQANDKLEAEGRSPAALKRYLASLEEAEKMSRVAQDNLDEIKSLCERRAPELEAIGCKDLSSLESPIMDVKSKIYSSRSTAEDILHGSSAKAVKKEEKEEVAAELPLSVGRKEPSPSRKETYQEKPKNVWELMWGGGDKKEPQKSQTPAYPESRPKEEIPLKTEDVFSSDNEGGDFE